MAAPVYLGIDLASCSARPSGYAVLDDGPRLMDVGLVRGDAEIVALARRHSPRFAAIDAPLGLPAGLCCLEMSCPCRPSAPDGIRACERDLRRRGIGLYYTTKRSIIRPMVYRAIELRRRIEEGGVPVIEVYPYASKVLLFGRPLPKKNTRTGLAHLRERLDGLLDGLPARPPLSHDELDAVVAAHTAYLFAHRRAEELGDSAEGVICVPCS